jgi:hypothetical protein
MWQASDGTTKISLAVPFGRVTEIRCNKTPCISPADPSTETTVPAMDRNLCSHPPDNADFNRLSQRERAIDLESDLRECFDVEWGDRLTEGRQYRDQKKTCKNPRDSLPSE